MELIIKPEGTFLGNKELKGVQGIYIQLPDSTVVSLMDIIDIVMTARYGQGWEKKFMR